MKDKKYYQPVLTEDEIADAAVFQKKCLEAFAEISHKYNDGKNFEIFSIGISLVISNFLSTIGITKIDTYLDDMVANIKRIHDKVRESSSYMEYRKGVKINEGNFN